jgi:predicted permease
VGGLLSVLIPVWVMAFVIIGGKLFLCGWVILKIYKKNKYKKYSFMLNGITWGNCLSSPVKILCLYQLYPSKIVVASCCCHTSFAIDFESKSSVVA